MKPNVVVVSIQGEASFAEEGRHLLSEVANVTYIRRPRNMTAPDAETAFADADYLAVTPAVMPKLTAALLEKLPRLRGISLHATGYDMVDVPTLERFNVTLTTLSDYATNAVAEHAMALLLSLSARIHLGNDRSRGLVPKTTSLRGYELAGRTAGVLGCGRIGQKVARLCCAFDMGVLGCDLKRGCLRGDIVDMPTLLRSSDVIMICTSMVHGAPPIIGASEFDQMRDGVTIANVSRPGLVDTRALVVGIRAGKVRGYAVDEIMHDLTEAEGDILREGRIIQSGHCAWWKDESLAVGKRKWPESVYRLVTGDPLNVVHGRTPVPLTRGEPSLRSAPVRPSLQVRHRNSVALPSPMSLGKTHG